MRRPYSHKRADSRVTMTSVRDPWTLALYPTHSVSPSDTTAPTSHRPGSISGAKSHGCPATATVSIPHQRRTRVS